MRIPNDDPRLTAYVLEELDGSERQEVSAAIHQSDELYREASEIRDTAQWLVAELQAAPLPGLAPEQADAVRAALQNPGEVAAGAPSGADGPGVSEDSREWKRVFSWQGRWLWWAPWFGAAAACMVGAFAAWKWWLSPTILTPRVSSLESAKLQPGSTPPPAVVVTREAPASEAEPQAGQPTVEAGPEAPPADSASSPRPMMEPRMMMRYGLLPKGYKFPVEDGAQPSPQPRGSGDSLSPDGTWRKAGGDAAARSDFYLPYRAPNVPAAGGEAYSGFSDSPFREVLQHPLSTFALDVDTASYSIVRRYLNQHQRPPHDAVRIEELINYFPYDYAPPAGDAPLAAHVEVAGCPWESRHRLLRIALKAREIAPADRPSCNLVFLIDVSGSMEPANKLPLLKQGLRLLVEKLAPRDTVGIVVYANDSRTVLWPTPGSQRERILAALDSLQAGGSTHGSAGIETAYNLAQSQFREGGVNRVILCTDGDFNVGITDRGQLAALIADKARTGVFLTVLGFGMGNYKDATVEALADRGNGNYAYVDTLNEAHKALVEQLRATLVTVAKDVKAQVEFNPAEVRSYRLLGYENRLLQARDFKDDDKDAGELGAGHVVTVLYELAPAHEMREPDEEDPLKYQPLRRRPPPDTAPRGETLTLKIRYKAPEADASRQLEFAVTDGGRSYAQASTDFKFAAAVAAFGMALRDSPDRGSASLGSVIELAGESLGADPGGYRAEFLDLVRRAQSVIPGR